jgi:hypothetical protein
LRLPPVFTEPDGIFCLIVSDNPSQFRKRLIQG